MTPRRLQVFGAPVDDLTVTEAAAYAIELAGDPSPKLMSTLNTDILRLYHSDDEFARVFNSARLISMDGSPLFKLARRFGSSIREKASGPDIMPEVCRLAAEQGLSCYILGGKPGVPEEAARKLRSRFGNLRIAGTLSPEYGFANSDESSRQVVDRIADTSPDILFICLGTPRSEIWWDRWKDGLGVPLSMSLGAAVDFTAGNVERAPRWMSDAGLEWLWRTIREPKRLAGRYGRDAAFLVRMLFRSDLKKEMRSEA